MKILDTVFVVGNENLAEPLSQVFRRRGTYVPLFESPENFSDAHGHFANACIKIANAAKSLRCSRVVLLGCSGRSRDAFRAQFSGVDVVEVDSFDEVVFQDVPGYLRPDRRVTIGFTAADSNLSGEVILIDSVDAFSVAIAKNLALAVGAKLVELPSVDKDEVDEISRIHHLWNSATNAHDNDDYKGRLLEKLRGRVGSLLGCGARNLSFVTKGVPYGVLPFAQPVAHLLNLPSLLGVVIAKALAKTYFDMPRLPLALLIAPDEKVAQEVPELAMILGQDQGYVVAKLLKERAKAFTVGLSVEYLPSDLIIFSSHAGEPKGDRVEFQFDHPTGTPRRMIYDSVLTVNDIPGNYLELHVGEFKRFVSFEGLSWPIPDREKTEEIREALRYYREVVHDSNVGLEISRTPSSVVQGSGVFKMFDSNFVPIMHVCGGYMSPFVFANACSTWRDIAGNFISAGVSGYVGTAQVVHSYIASDVLYKFIVRIGKGQSVSYALYESQKSFVADLGYTPYLYGGLMCNTLKPVQPFFKNVELVKKEYRRHHRMYMEALENPSDEKFKKRHKAVADLFERNLKDLTALPASK